MTLVNKEGHPKDANQSVGFLNDKKKCPTFTRIFNNYYSASGGC